MQFWFKYVFFIVIGCFCFSCSNTASKTVTAETINGSLQIEKLNWLIGDWCNSSAKGNLFETWEKKNDSTLTGKSFFINSIKDTLSSETMTLEQRGNSLFFIPIVKDQNDGKPVKYTLTISLDNKFVFENPAHDFPTKISYTKITNDSLYAEISGMENGKATKVPFPFKRNK